MFALVFKRVLRVGVAALLGNEVAGAIPVSAETSQVATIAVVAGFGRWLRHRFPNRMWTRILPF